MTDTATVKKKSRNRSTSKAPKLRSRKLHKEEEESLPVVSPSLTAVSVPLSTTSSNGAIEFFYKPHHLTGLFLLIGYLLKVAFYDDESITRDSVLK